MKKIVSFFLIVVSVFGILSCSKSDEHLEVDLSKYNSDITVENDIDKWLSETFVNPYNIEVIYRLERNFTNVARDISPVGLEKVEPMMNAVLKTFLQTYEEVAGSAFIKKYTPKQFVLYGSPSYNDNGSITLGTADNGRRIVLYELNSLNFNNPNQVKRPIRTIHHEFAHILNQNIVIPPSFEQISKRDYTADWTGAANTPAVAKSLGFISQYARSSFGEDFAEMVAFLLVEGQVFFDNYCATTTIEAANALREKEKLVIAYYKDYFGIDFKILQATVQKSLKDNYNAVEPEDNTQSILNLILNNKLNNIKFDPTSDIFKEHGISKDFEKVWKNYVTAVSTQDSVPLRRFPQTLSLMFSSSTRMVLRVEYLNANNVLVNADYNFDFIIDPLANEIKFSKSLPEGTTTAHNNGAVISLKPSFEKYLLPYFTNRVFTMEWLPKTISSTDPLFRTLGGFSEKGSTTNFYYGPIVLK
ncbi:substrate import-associated zinc metallohydrolase lipoprotein [Sphingobacterium composti Ten et al. 2007 non Yoo et al. 2007]|uniref:substrate import-associated zinc metallohydrolase lipoprotein n=1 Tax=Sphingobacterium composti TaxID=363260 RepID=UPI00135A4C92|nr:substrate import-associated zinc metallohydrolase lipoprotein [Sphingobacterium composti Ten et al. 2007 non Yoo et al. 2007]